MPYLVIATTDGASAPFARLVAALQRLHGYQVAVVEAPADATLLRLGNHQMFVAYQVAGAAPLRQPLLIRLRALAPDPNGQPDRLDIEFLSVPSSLYTSAQWLISSPAPLLFGQYATTWPATPQTLATSCYLLSVYATSVPVPTLRQCLTCRCVASRRASF